MEKLDAIISAMERIPREELVRALGALHDRKVRGADQAPPSRAASALAEAVSTAASTEPRAPASTTARTVTRLLVDAATKALSGARPAPPTAGGPYDEVRRGLVAYERTLRDYSTKVGSFLDSVRRQDAAERERRSTLPQITLRMTGPAAGATGARFVVHNTRETAAQLSIRGGPFRARAGGAEVVPRVRLELADVELVAGERRVVFLGLDFAGTGVGAGVTMDGHLTVDLGGAESLSVAVEVELVGEVEGGAR